MPPSVSTIYWDTLRQIVTKCICRRAECSYDNREGGDVRKRGKQKKVGAIKLTLTPAMMGRRILVADYRR